MEVTFPLRFCLLADNNKYVSRWLEPQIQGANVVYEVNCIGEVRDAPQVVFEVGDGAVKLRHVETGNWAIHGMGLMLLYSQQTISVFAQSDYYFWLEPVDVRNNRATLHCSLVPWPNSINGGPHVDTSFRRYSRANPNGALFMDSVIATWQDTQPVSPTIFSVYDSALSTVWRQVDFFLDQSITENTQVFSRSAFTYDNSNFDQTVIMRPTIALTETIETNWSRSRAFGFSQSISVTSKVPFVAEIEIGFTAEQSFAIDNGGSYTMSVEHSVQVEVPVPPFRVVQIVVTGFNGKLSIPFRLVEVATYRDGMVRERTLDDGFCSNVSSSPRRGPTSGGR